MMSENETPFSSTDNEELRLAERFVEETGCNLFLTGRAGTGKTTFLKNLQKQTNKKLIITAPTGVAAINAGGVTLHSFFQLPLGPFVPGNDVYDQHNRRQFRFSKEKKTILKHLDLLVIDEISMVRADLLDAVDAALRHHRANPLPFGGVQLLMIGDLFQLPPVIKRDEWELLGRFYQSAYFFNSRALAHAGFTTIELKKIYRQSDDGFIHILNQLRHNRLDDQSIRELNKRYVEGFVAGDNEGYITLTTHNRKADTINRSRLQGLPGKGYLFEARVSGDFPKQNFPAPEALRLKKGAQVMFLRNDSSPDKSYYNGKIGRIVRITSEEITVACTEDPEPIHIEPAIWENVKYSLEPKSAKIEAKTVGTFKQYPLKLAWAITIHKSQGLTFGKVIIDSEAAFAQGQTYVALSRCKTLDGIVLSSQIPSKGIHIDPAIKTFARRTRENPPSGVHLTAARTSYQQRLILECFDFKELRNRLAQLVRLVENAGQSVRFPGPVDLPRILSRAEQDLFRVGYKFQGQLKGIFHRRSLPESDSLVLERLEKASGWFQDKFREIFGEITEDIQFETGDSVFRQKLENALNHLQRLIVVKRESIKSLEHGFSPSHYRHRVALAETRPIAQSNHRQPIHPSSGPDSTEPALIDKLNDWRSRKSDEEGIAKHQVIRRKVLVQIAQQQAISVSALKQIPGLGKKTVQKYGQEIIAIIDQYRQEQGPEDADSTNPVSREKTDALAPKISETKKISYDLFCKGLTIDQIAEKRGLVKSTIEIHLCSFIELGLLDINRLLLQEKQASILAQLEHSNTDSLKQVKEALGDDYSYGEIRMVLSCLKIPKPADG